MPIAAFLGPGRYGYKPDERPRSARAPSAPEDQRRYAAALKGIGRLPHCIIDLAEPEPGLLTPTPEALARACAAALFPPGLLRPPTTDKGPPAGTKPPPIVPPAAREPRYVVIQHDIAAVAPGSAERFSQLISTPVVIEHLHVVGAASAGSIGHWHALLRYGDDQTAGIQSNDVDLWTYPDPTSGVGSILASGDGAVDVDLQLNTVITTTPFIFHSRVIATVANNHAAFVYICRIIEADELKAFAPSALYQADVTAGKPHYALPPSRAQLKFPGQPGPQGLNSLSALEILADALRTSPFGIPHSEMLLRAGMAGFRDPEAAVALAIRMAARPPNFNLLASRLR